MRNISKLFIFFVAIACFSSIVFGEECLQKCNKENEDQAHACVMANYCSEDLILGLRTGDCENERKECERLKKVLDECLHTCNEMHRWQVACSGLSNSITASNIQYLDQAKCCFTNNVAQPACSESSNDTWENNLDTWGNNWEVGSSCCPEWYLEGDGSCCNDVECIPSTCEEWEGEVGCAEENPEASQSCNTRRSNGEPVIWNDSKCKCECDPNLWCCGVQLNTVVPFIWDCIELTSSTDTSQGLNQLTAFPYLMKWLSKIVVTIIMILSIIIVVVAWLMMTTSVAKAWNYETWLKWLWNVIKALILLWISWLILKLINPTFFGG